MSPGGKAILMIQLSPPGLEERHGRHHRSRRNAAKSEAQNWTCGPFGFWPLTFPWGVSWGFAVLVRAE